MICGLRGLMGYRRMIGQRENVIRVNQHRHLWRNLRTIEKVMLEEMER
jgi:hypothetical protein